jgi:hypothetical protein
MKRAIIVVFVLALLGAGGGVYYMRRNGGVVTINKTPVTRGEIIDTVGSTGTLQAVTTVRSAASVGNISWFGADFNSSSRKAVFFRARLDHRLRAG